MTDKKLPEMFCSKCHSPMKTELSNTIHWARADCNKCGHWLWLSKQEGNKNKKGKRTKTSQHTIKEIYEKFHRLKKITGQKKPFCFMCNRTKKELGHGEKLTVDHILEHGPDKPWNLQILCTMCHAHKRHVLTYITHHLVRREPYK